MAIKSCCGFLSFGNPLFLPAVLDGIPRLWIVSIEEQCMKLLWLWLVIEWLLEEWNERP